LTSTGFYRSSTWPPNGRIDVAWQDERETPDFIFNVRDSYSTGGGKSWTPNIRVDDHR